MLQRHPLTIAACFTSLLAVAQPPPGYYDPAMGYTGEALKQALHDIIDGHSVLLYSSLWSAFQSTDDRPDGYVWDIYSDVPGGTAPYLYTFGTDQCGTYSGEGDCYNREHSFPKSWFNDLPPMDTDLHHIYPTDGWVNTKRGDLPYGEVGSPDWTGQNGTKTGTCVFPGYTGTVCEPIDEYKGDLARSYFYMLTRYAPEATTWSCDMLSAGEFSPWAEALLLQWNAADPVSIKETDRNNAVYALQGNRNPYIDHPEWVTYIWGPNAAVADLSQDTHRAWISEGVLHTSGFSGVVRVEAYDLMGRKFYSGVTQGDPSTFMIPSIGIMIIKVWDAFSAIVVR